MRGAAFFNKRLIFFMRYDLVTAPRNCGEPFHKPFIF